MSKIGKQPVELPEGVTVSVAELSVEVKGPKGILKRATARGVKIEVKEGKVLVSVNNTSKQNLANWGTTRSLIANMVKGVTDGWEKQLELIGTGYRAEVKEDTLVLTVGYSHDVEIKAPKDISFKVEKNIVTVSGIDRAVVGQVAANVRATRPPEPYKGKGVKYIDEIVRRKAGKAAKTAA
ncbi:50S ribosomal protein L6 [Candidatus Microgenomates bacterium]|nr:50S ribosomal protein L6 [Candidatus Microgenomates bacterium]